MSTPHLTLTESGARDDVFGFGKLKSNVTQLFPQRAQPETDRPDELLQDLRLRQELCHRLAEPLGELGYALEETEVVDPYTGTDRRLVSVLRRTIHIWYVLEVPPVVLNDASYLHRSLFGYLEFLFPPESRLRIVSPGLGVHRQPYETMARGWRDRGRWVTFINWAWLEELLDSDNVPLDRLAQTLDVPLEDQPPTSVAPAPSDAPARAGWRVRCSGPARGRADGPGAQTGRETARGRGSRGGKGLLQKPAPVPVGSLRLGNTSGERGQ